MSKENFDVKNANMETLLEWLGEESTRLKEEIRKTEKYMQYKAVAMEFMTLNIALTDSGFSKEEAMEIIKTGMLAAFPKAEEDK